MTLEGGNLRSMPDLREELDKKIKAEEILGGRNMFALSNILHSSKRERNVASPGDKNKKNKNKENIDNPYIKKNHKQYTSLTTPVREVYAQIDQSQLPAPKKMMTLREKGTCMSKYC